jgi:hypothetical protein
VSIKLILLALQRLTSRIVEDMMRFMMLLGNESGVPKATYRYWLTAKPWRVYVH